jgi:glycosyltransferase involved in cell wall biosynthesis
VSPDVSVITPTRNRAELLARCLHYLSNQTLASERYELLVVDDASTDTTREVLEDAARTSRCAVRTFRLEERTGVPGARNHAISRARGSIIVFVDSDNMAAPAFLEAHLAIHEANRQAIGRGPVIQTRSLEEPFASRRGLLDISTAYFDTDNASVRRDHLVKAGPFDQDFYPYGWEGLDLGFRLRALGLRRVFRRDAALYHYQEPVSRESLGGLLTKEEERARTAWLFYAKHPTLEARLALQFTPFHVALNAVQRLFGLVHPGNVEALMRRADRARLPGVGRLLLSGVLNARYLAHLHASAQRRPGVRTDGN